MLLFEALAYTLASLQEQGARTALLGGLAVSTWTEPRFTRDVDLAVAVQTDADAERLVHGLLQRGYRLGQSNTNALTASSRNANSSLVRVIVSMVRPVNLSHRVILGAK
jgi:hypothetical protein